MRDLSELANTTLISSTASIQLFPKLIDIPDISKLPVISPNGGNEKNIRLYTKQDGDKYIVAEYKTTKSESFLAAAIAQQKILHTLFPDRYVVNITDAEIGIDSKARFVANFVEIDQENSYKPSPYGMVMSELMSYIEKIRTSESFQNLIPEFRTIGLIPLVESNDGDPYINELAGNTLFDKNGNQIIVDVQSPIIDILDGQKRPALDNDGVIKLAREKGVAEQVLPLLQTYQKATNALLLE